MHLTDKQLESLWEHLRRVPEFRARKGLRHPLTVVLVIVLAARLAGKRNTKQIAQFGRRLTSKQLRRAGARPQPRTGVCRAPSLNTIRRVLQGVEAQRLERELDAWLAEQGQQQEPGEALALDGKTLRGSYDHDLQEDGEVADKAAQQQLTVAGIDTRQVYAQQGLTGKKEDAEAQVARELLERLDIRGRCIVADALHTQRETAQTILDQAGFYLFTVKSNQPTLLEQLSQDYHWEQHAPYSATDCGHGRIETRTMRVSEDLNRVVQWLDFPGARVAAQVLREVREKKTGQQRETVVAYLLTNLPPQHARGPALLRLNRGYWGAIENGVHRVARRRVAGRPVPGAQGPPAARPGGVDQRRTVDPAHARQDQSRGGHGRTQLQPPCGARAGVALSPGSPAGSPPSTPRRGLCVPLRPQWHSFSGLGALV